MTLRHLILSSATVASLTVAAPAGAVNLGVQDDGLLNRDPASVYSSGHTLGATYTRMIVNVGDPTVPAKMRAARAEGYKVILTIGGTATGQPHPSARSLLAYIRRLPRAEKYTVINEPDMVHEAPCSYLAKWLKVRHVVGSRLLWGDTSPHGARELLEGASRCKGHRLPRALNVADHPYQWKSDPLGRASASDTGSMGNLPATRRWVRKHLHVKITWWLTEFGYPTTGGAAATPEQNAWLWQRAIAQADRVQAKVLVVYQLLPSGVDSHWDTHIVDTPAWCLVARYAACQTETAPVPVTDAPAPWDGV